MRNVTLALIALAALIAAACSGGSDAPATAEQQPSAEPTTARSVADVVADAETAEADEADLYGGGGSGGSKPGGDQVASQRPTRLKVDTPERQRLVQAVESAAALSSYEFEWSMVLPTIPDVPGGISFGGSGAIDPVNERFAMTMDFTDMFASLANADDLTAEELALFQSFVGEGPMQIRYVDQVVYINWSIFGLFLGSETPWIAVEDTSTDGAFASSTAFAPGSLVSPEDAAAFLRDVWGVEDLGRETIRGVETTHYRGVIDFTELMTDLSPSETAELQADLNGTDLSEVFGDFPVDVWIDDENVMRRLEIEVDFSGFGSAGRAAEGIVGSTFMSYEFFNIGGAISVVAPPASEVTFIDESLLSSFDFS